MEAAKDVTAFLRITAGRDKLYRTAQYASRLLLRGAGSTKNSENDSLLRAFEFHVTTSRKLFRLFSTVDFALKAFNARRIPDDIESVLETVSHLFKSIWLLLDHVIWFSKMKLISINEKSVARKSNWVWLCALFLSVLQDIYKINLRKKVQQKQLYWNLVRNICDLLIPIGNLKLICGHDRETAGLFGIISSLMGAYEIWTKEIKHKVN